MPKNAFILGIPFSLDLGRTPYLTWAGGSGPLGRAFPGSFRRQKAVLAVVVHHTHGLQEGIDDGGADEPEAPFLQVPGDPVAQLGARRQSLASRAICDHRFAVNEVPQVAIERAELLLHPEKS